MPSMFGMALGLTVDEFAHIVLCGGRIQCESIEIVVANRTERDIYLPQTDIYCIDLALFFFIFK